MVHPDGLRFNCGQPCLHGQEELARATSALIRARHNDAYSSRPPYPMSQPRLLPEGERERGGQAIRTVIAAVDCAPLAWALAQKKRPENPDRITTVRAGDNAHIDTYAHGSSLTQLSSPVLCDETDVVPRVRPRCSASLFVRTDLNKCDRRGAKRRSAAPRA